MPEPSSASDVPLPVIVAAVVGGTAIVTFVLNSWWTALQERRARRRRMYAKAFSLAIAYCEYPFVIRRRRASQGEAERVRISSELRKVQEGLAFHSAWLRLESNRVAAAFDSMVSETRAVAGALMREAWDEAPIEDDRGMNLPDVARSLEILAPARERYLEEVKAQLSFVPAWLCGWRQWRLVKKVSARLAQAGEGAAAGRADHPDVTDSGT